MTRKDYIAIARGFERTFINHVVTITFDDREPAYRVWLSAVAEVSFALADDNPRFDRHRFIDACHGSAQTATSYAEAYLGE